MNRFSTLLSSAIPSAMNKNSARILTTIAAFVLLISVTGWAQRGGGGGHGGGAGFGGGHGGAVGVGGGMAGRAGIAGGRVGMGHAPGSRVGRPGSSRGFSHGGSHGHSHGHNDRFQSRFFRRNNFPNCWGFGCWNWAYPWWGYYPYGWGDDSSIYDRHDHNDDSDESSDRENYQDARMAPPWGYGYPYPYGPPPMPPATPSSAAREPQAGSPIIPATVLVFRDHHKQEVQSYAIVGQTLWNFTTAQQIEKIALTDLDLAATVKVNNERGRSFRIPSNGRGANGAPPVPSNT